MYSDTHTYILAILIVFTKISSGKYFEPGYDHHYVYKSTSDYLGMHNVTSVMKFHIRFVNSSGNGNLHSLYLDSFVQFSQSGYYAENPLDWNLSKPFLFVSTHDGVVDMVHIHPEDQDEVLTLKKVLASTLSVKVKISNESTSDYISNERDHLGDLTHEYRSETTSSGLTLRRYHRSLDKIERIHEKITQMDNRGTIHSVESEDSYIMEDRLRKDYETKRQPYPEEYVIKTSMEGDIGIIKANSKNTMRLVGKRRTKVEDVHHGLLEDDLIIKQKTEEKLTMKNISEDVNEALRCIHNYTDKGHTNRTVCVNRLRQKVLKLETSDYELLAENFLNRTCGQNDTKCIDEKYLFTDIIARAGDPFSQHLILKFLLSDKHRDDEVLRRIFIHLSVIEHPIQETIAVVEKICFGEQDSHHTKGKVILTETQRRACLCVGSMAKAINSKGNNTEAERLMDKIHTWLYTQGDVTPEHLRPKRYIMVADNSVSDDHLLSKVVLLHSLGNAGLQSSISHLKTFAQPNTRQSAWRRAALSSLRHYVCHESATILLTSILHDETESVRQVAWIEYGQHPKRNNLTTEQQNLIFSRKYTYQTVMRARREASLDTVLIEFKVELPEIHWGKSVGNSKIGASFGVDMVNKLHIRLQPLSGFLRINIFDRIYAEAHVGILGLEVDILKIVACYKGKIEYNMNVLKHFAYGKDQELFESFNAAADEIIGPIVQSVKGMSDNFKSSSGESKSVFASLSASIRNIPLQTKKFLEASIKLTSLLDRFHGLPLISRAKYVAFKLQSLAEDIKNDALIFYQTISDDGLVTLLHAEEQLTEATNSIVEAQKKIGQSPRQAFESLSAAKKRITIGMQQILEAKSKMSEALSGHGGSLPGWLSSQEETKMLTDAVQNMLLKVKSKLNNYEATTNDDGTDWVDFSSLKNIEEALQDCLRELHDIYDASEPFLQAFTYTMRKVEELKKAVELIDKATKASQRKVLANFGAKFHPKFPSQRRGTDINCKEGTWPSTAGGMYNDTPGIDVLVDWNEKVPCPVSGYVMRTCTPDEILIIPSGEQFKGYEVLIRNINPSSTIPYDMGIQMNAGGKLGVGRGKGICDDSYIHVAIRQREGSEKSCSYIDPSSFVDNPKPFPKWEQECKEFTFKHIGQIIEAGLSGKGFADLFGKLIKRAVAWAAAEIIDKISTAFPKSQFVQMARQFSLAYLSKYNKMIAKVFLNSNKDLSSGTGLMAACGEQSTTQSSQAISAPKPPGDEPDDPSVSKKTISQTYEALGNDTSNGTNRLQAIKSAIQNLQNAASELPMENMAAMPFLRYGQILTRLDVPSRGGKQSMPTMFQMLLWKACPTFENGLVQGYGHICIPLEGCRGLNCSISIPFGITTSKLPVMVMFDLDAMVFRIDVKNESISIPVSENPVNFYLRQTIFAGYTAILVSQASNITINLGHAYQLTQTMHLCDAELTCLQNVGIFHDLTFFQHRGRVERSADGKCSVSFGANFEGHGKVSAGLDIGSNGQIVGGGINTEINVGENGKITGGFHGSTDGTWHTDLGTELDVGDGTTVKGSVEVDGNKDGKVSYGVGVEAQFGDKGSIGGFVKGNSDGEITAGMQGSVKIANDTIKAGGWIQHDRNGTHGGGIASVDFNGKGSISASVNASSDGTINAGIGGEMRIGNTSIQAEGHVHHDHNGTSGGISAGAQFGNDGQIKTSLEGNSNGEITGGLEGDMKLGNGSSVHGALYVHHDKNGTSGGGMLSGNFGKDGHIQASVNRSNTGAIDAGLGGQLNMGNTSINGEAHIHHDQNGTSGGGSLSAQFGNNNSLAASVEGNSDGTIKGQVEGTVHVGNGTFHGAGYVQHDSNGTSGGGVLSGDFGRDGNFQASVNRSNTGAIDAGLGGQLNMGNTSINGEAHIHHDQNGTSGGGSLSAQFGNNNSLAASVEGNSDGTIKGQVEGTVHVGNGTFHGAGYVQHDSNGTSGGGVLSGDFGRDGNFQASVNRSNTGAIDAGLGGQLNMGNTSINGEAHIHHDQNGTSGGGSLSAQFGNNNSLAASVEGNSDGTIKGQVEGTVHVGNGTFHGAGYVQHDSNGTSGGGVLSGDFGRDGNFQASVNRSNTGAIDAGLGGQLNMGNTSINGEAHIHHDQNGTSGGASISAQFGNNNSLAASVEGNSDGTIKGQVEGTVHVGNGTFYGAGYVQHDSNGTSGGGVLSGDFGSNGNFQASVNGSNTGAIDAGLGGQLNMGNTSINGEAHIHHDQNGTSGGGSLSAQFGNNNSLAASVEGNSDGTIKGQVEGTVHVGNGTFHGAGYVQHDSNGTSGGGVLSGDFGRDGNFQASVNRSNTGAIDAGLGGQLNMGNTSINGEAHIHHDQNGTSGGGSLSAQFGNNNSLAASVEGNSDGTIKGQVEGTVHVGNGTFYGAGYVQHDSNGTSGGGVLSGDFGSNGNFQASVNGSNTGAIDAGLGGQLNMGNTSIDGEAHIHHDQNGTSGGASISAQFGNNNSIDASVEGNSDGTIKGQVEGTVHVGNGTFHGAGYVQHDSNGTSGGGVLSGDFGRDGNFQASVNRSNTGAIDAGLGGQLNMGNTSINGEAHIHHDQNGTSGGGSLSAQFGNNNSLAASVEGNSDGTIKGQVEGTVHVGNGTFHGAGYVQHDSNGTSGGGVLSGDFGRDGNFQASVNRSNTGAIDAGLGGQLNMGNTSINGEAHIHHDQNGTSGGGSLSAQFGNNNSLAASVEGNSDGTIKGQVEGTVHVGNGTFHGAGYVQHDSNGTSGGGVLSGDFGRDGNFQASVNRSNTGAIDAGLGGQLNMGNTSINGEAHIHHDQNGTSGGGSLSAQFGNNNSLAASVEGNSDGTIKGQVEGTVHVGNGTFYGAGYVQHDSNGTSGGGVLSGDFGSNGNFQASVNGSNTGAIDAGLGGQLNMGNTSINGEAHIHHDQNGTSGGGSLSAQFGNNNSLAASVEGNSDGTIKGQVEGTVHVGNGTFHGAGYVQHDSNGTSGGGVLSGDFGRDGNFQASVNRSNTGAIDAGLGGQLNMGNTSINGEAHIHHDQNGTSGGGSLSAQFGNNNSLAASVEGNSDGTIKGQVEGTVHVGNGTFYGAGYVQHDSNGTSGGGVLSGDFGSNGNFQASVNGSNTGAIDAGLGGQLNMGNTSIDGEAHIHHDQNGTSRGASISAQFGNNNSIDASVEGNSDGTINGQVEGTVHVGNGTFHRTGYMKHSQNGTIGWMDTLETDEHIHEPSSYNEHSNVTTLSDASKVVDEPNYGPKDNNVTKDSITDRHSIGKRTSDKCSFDMTGNFDANGNFNGLGVGATIPGFGNVGANIKFQDGQVVGDISIGDFKIPIPNADSLNLELFSRMFAEHNLDKDEISKIQNDMNDGIRHKLVSVEKSVSVELTVDAYEEDEPARDKKDGVEYKDRHIDITIFSVGWTFGVGPIGLRLEFGAGGAIGMSMWSDVRTNSGATTFSIGPWVSGMVWGGISLELGIASGGLKLIGYILKTKFPVTEETQQGKHPVTVVMKIDLELTPIELSLRGWAKVFGAKVFDKRIWSWACEPITWNILTKKFVDNDQDAPQFINGGFCGNTTRSKRSVDECLVKQLIDRHPTDPAFQIVVYTNDENSVVTQFYGIGTYPGGTDVVSWTEFRGSTQIVPMQLPNGIPLYFTIKAENSQGLKSYLKCKLNTYDTTLPGGRVEASHPFTSIPNQIAGTVIVMEDSPVIEAYHALGYSPGEYGTQVTSWQTLNLENSDLRNTMNSDLKYFSNPREGRLSASPVKVLQIKAVEGCASQCKQYGPKCMSFDFEETSESCNFHDAIEGGQIKLHIDGRYKNYERLDVGYTAYISYTNIQIQHGAMYYINALIKNSLHYVSVLHSGGTMADFTPPEPGNIGRPVHDVMEAIGCNASVIQRCEQVTWLPNHRKIIDGSDGTTIFNGHKPLQEVKYTISNHYISANWDGFHDEESGIYGFTWASGTNVCGTNILKYTNPHAHLSSSKFWTYSGYATDLHLPDGQYYVTIQAVNNVVFGGAMVTTVCHSTPVTVDTTPPVFFEVSDVMYDEDFDILAVYYNVSDPLSGILRVDFGLGRTKHDVELRGYSRHNYMVRDDPFLVIDNLDLEPGIPAWIRLRAVNNVELFGSGHSNEPIMVDKTPPLPGKVLDGDVLGQDREYQHDTDTICSQWTYFYDPESGINQFIWGVGTAPGKDNILPYRNLSSTTKRSCHAAELKHNVTYYSTIIAYNDALNAKSCNSSSNGILVDTTPPEGGSVIDVGSYENTTIDIAFSSESATVKASWNNFSDAESYIASYTADIYINREHVKTIHTGTDTNLLDHSLSLKHLDNVYIDVLALNGADLWVRAASDGFLVDHTPPNVIFLEDSFNGEKYQSDKSKLSLRWDFLDAESWIAEYRYVVNELYMGRHSAIVPRNGKFETLIPSAASLVNLDLHTLNLLDGALYTVQVTALNKARLSSSHESAGIIIDTSPPSLSKVHIGRPMDEEELDEFGYVLHASQSCITVSWRAFDPESGIETVQLAIGTIPGNMTGGDGSVTITSDDSVAELSGLKLQPTTRNDSIYYVSVQVVNKAGLKSRVEHSKPIKVLKANVAGTVYDGTTELEDIDFSSDVSTVTMSFNGFESEACNIIGYEWAIGFLPYGSDVLPFTDYGIVMINDTFGHAQINLQLYDNQLYFSTVRARTGHNCHEQYIVSTSDGFKVDTTGPRIDFIAANNTYTSEAVYDLLKTSYQDQTDSIHLTWNVTDLSGVNDVIVSVGHLPYGRDKYNSTETKSNSITPGDVKLHPGEAVFVNILTTDMSGLRTELSSPAIVTDVSSPDIHDFVCTDYISIYKTLLTCTWSKVEEYESSIASMSFAFGTKSLSFDIANFTNIPLDRFGWTRDMHSFVGRDNVKAIFTAFRVQNILGLKKVLEFKTVVDKTPPVGGNLIFTTQMGGTKDVRRELCQIPTSYVEVDATEPVDEESSVERYEIALGTSAGSTDILSFRPVSSVHSLFLGDLALPIGSIVFASMKAYNRAGLYSVVNSDGIVVSPHPLLTVNDGPGGDDLDFQSKMSVIEGNWHYSDPCPVVSAEWSVVDLTGKVLQNFTAIAGARNHFYNDELSTENGFTYISIIRIEDAIGRTYTAETDGVTIRIQTPSPGYINDGLEQDINFQISTTELSANWGGFGDPTSDNPVQKISHYEVAIGNDRRFEKTRTNVHFFVNVGLNTSYTFTKLNLTKKIVQYYVTVRAYSHAGSFEEVYSNGIRVGYHEGVTAGKVQHNRYEHTTNRVVVSWDGFASDYGIRQYEVGISNNNTLPLNETMECKLFYQRYSRAFDVQSLMSAGTNTYSALENLTLQHDNTYYVTVVATDESGMCIAMNAGPLTIDTTSPLSGTLIFDGTSGHVNFVTDERSMHISWMGFEDKESGIRYFNISLKSGNGCSQNEMIIVDSIIQSVTVYNLTETTFYNLNLEINHVYYVTLIAVNGAELNTKITSVPILLDTTYTSPGTVKIGYDWFHETTIQSSLTEIGTTLAVARDEESHKCPHQEEIISPTTKLLPNSWIKLRQDFSPSCVIDGRIPIEIQMRHSDDLTNVVKGGISSEIMSIRQGLYTFLLKGLSGENMFASLAVASSIESIPSNITHLIEREEFSKNMSLNSTNEEERGQNVIGQDDQYGAGFFIPGFLVENYTCYCLVWAKDMYKFEVKFLQLDICADKVATEYGIDLEHVNISTGMTWQAKFLINGVEKININSLHFKDTVAMFVFGFNDNDYIPPVRDPFSPFETKLSINSIKVPVSTDKPCMYGAGFYDGESSIKEIWIGISNSLNETGNVREMKLEKKFCLPCNEKCPMVCDPNCTHESLHAFDVMSFNIRNLSLLSSSNISAQEKGDTRRADNSTGFDILHANSYFINVRILNFAGLETNVNSKAVIIDDTPPIATYVICADPIHNLDEPSVFQGTNSSMAAFWDFDDDISQIMGYTVSIGSRKGSDDIVSNMALGLRKSVVIHNLTDYLRHNETYFITVTATNEAKLKTSSSCNITIDLNVPDVANSGAVTMFSIAVTDGPPNVTFLESSDSIGVDWKNDDPDVEFFEMQIGSTKGVADILPRVKIGTKKSKKAAVINGHLWLDNVNINTNVQQFVLKNWTNESLNEAKRHGGYFHFEPGRCLNIGLYAISRSHLSSKIPVQPMCIKRDSDVVISFEKVMSHSVIRSGNALKISKANSTDFHLSFKGLSGGLTVGLLQNSDWDSLYGSAASSDFKPYVSSPESPTRTSRLLKKRILKYSGSPFFVAPVGETMIADYINVSLRFNKTEFEPGITVPVLAEWNDEAEMWQAVHENCIAEENIDYDSSIYKSKICLPGINLVHSRKRRAAISYTAEGPRMFALFVVNKTLAQSTPHLITNEMFCVEDGFQGKLQLQYTDEENDSVSFQILQGPGKGIANITEDGVLYYKPNKDFAGQDALTLMLMETSLPYGSMSKPSEQVIHIVVKGVNDPPLLFLVLGNETINAKYMQHVSKNIEANSTLTEHLIGTYIAVDIDEHDNLSLLTRFDDDNGINVTMNDVDDTKVDLLTVSTAVTPRTVKTFDLTINMSAEFYGIQNYSVRISDNANTYSLPITLTINVMINPCVFGTCQVNPYHNISCTDPVRTTSFEFFSCLCKPGYHGQWCQLEIDECSTNPCPVLYDCHDMVNDYKCTVNILHLLLIILGAAVVAALCILVCRRIKSSKANPKVFPARCELESHLDQYEQLDFLSQGRQHGMLCQGRKLMDTSFRNYASDPLDLPPPYQDKDERQDSSHHKGDPKEDNPSANDIAYQDFRHGVMDPEISGNDMKLPSLLPVVGSLGAPHHKKLNLDKGKLESAKTITPIDV